MFRSRKIWAVAVFLLFVAAGQAHAQNGRKSWGIVGGVAPKWMVPDYQEPLFDAANVDLHGPEVRIGVARGQSIRGDWGVSFVSRGIADRGAAVVKDDGTTYATHDNRLTGVEFHKFSPFKTFNSRFQIGVSFGGGVGWFRGAVTKTVPGLPPLDVPAKELLTIGETVMPVVPLFRLELVGAVIASQHLKIRIGGGINFPGQQVVSVTGVYFF